MGVLLASLLAAASAAGSEAPRTVVLVTLDSTRADHLGCYGYPRPTTPFLDRLARAGIVFEDAFASISLTTPSHVSIFTGLDPLQHGVHTNEHAMPDSGYSTLAELFTSAGYETAAFTGVRLLGRLARGFRYQDLGGDKSGYRKADATVDQALAWLRGRPVGRPLFLWIHFYDPHAPPRAPAEHLRALAFRSTAEKRAFAARATGAWGVPLDSFPSPEALADAYARYDAEIRFVDRELERLFQSMERSGRGARSLWVVTADHGEGLGNHGHMTHGRFVYREQIRVPLIFFASGRLLPARVTSPVHHLDLWPTFAAMLALPAPQPGFTLEGHSLWSSLLSSAAPPTRPLYAHWWPNQAKDAGAAREHFAIHDADWKYIAKTDGDDELYDLRDDPLELRNLIQTPSPVKERLASLARTTWARFRAESARASPRPVDKSVEEELRALGYVN